MTELPLLAPLVHATARPYSYNHYIHFHNDSLERVRRAERASYVVVACLDDQIPLAVGACDCILESECP